MKFWTWALLILLVILIKFSSAYSGFIEHYYSNGIYPVISKIQRILLGWIPFSAGDLLYGFFLIVLLVKTWQVVRTIFKRRLNRQYLLTGLKQIIFFFLLVYVFFYLLWGLNYSRKGIARQLDLRMTSLYYRGIRQSSRRVRQRRPGGRRGPGELRPAQQRQLPRLVLGERRTRLHPVTGIGIERAADLAQVGAVDVPAHHRRSPGFGHVRRRSPRTGGCSAPEADAQLQALGERPVRLSERAAHVVDEVAETDAATQERVAQARQPGRAAHRAVELVPVQHQQPRAARGAVHPLAVHLELALQHLREHRETRIVVAGDVDQACAGTLARQQRAHHLGVLGTPEGALGQAQGVDDVADQHDAAGLDTARNSFSSRARAWRKPRWMSERNSVRALILPPRES